MSGKRFARRLRRRLVQNVFKILTFYFLSHIISNTRENRVCTTVSRTISAAAVVYKRFLNDSELQNPFGFRLKKITVCDSASTTGQKRK